MDETFIRSSREFCQTVDNWEYFGLVFQDNFNLVVCRNNLRFKDNESEIRTNPFWSCFKAENTFYVLVETGNTPFLEDNPTLRFCYIGRSIKK